MQIDAPVIANLVAKDNVAHSRFVAAINLLNKALTEKQIWNVEFNDLKSDLQYWGIERACKSCFDQFLAKRGRDYSHQEWQNDFSSWCDFNQASGRIVRLTKTAPKNVITDTYIAILKEVAALNAAIKAVKPFIVKGRRPAENPVEPDYTNTGICPICTYRQKLNADKMVHHGFKISDGHGYFGYRAGKCFGTAYLCYELSNEGNIAFETHLQGELLNGQRQLRWLKSGEPTEFSRMEYKRGPRGNYENTNCTYRKSVAAEKAMFETLLNSEITNAERFIRDVKSEIKTQQERIQNWTLQPLKYGRKKV